MREIKHGPAGHVRMTPAGGTQKAGAAFQSQSLRGALAKVCGVPRTRIERLASEATGVTPDTALRLSKAFGTTAALWLNLQNAFDVQIAERKIGKELKNIEPVIGHAA
ncbi:HigA family addiction module antitoxin [Bradyrhizobium sp.]|uniref:HigA family addiction module antitoxin n=1 Tax=Bradyrhizobium sp. TaxID=376 RepID=UPI003C70C4C3